MNPIKRLSLLLLTLALGGGAVAQNKLTIDKVYRVTLRNSGTIIENEQIKGYYFFYVSDKVDRKTNEYTLQIVDENLNKLKDIKFTDEKNVKLLESSYNGGALSFTFYNDKENSLEYRIFGLDGKRKQMYSKTIEGKSEAYFEAMLAQTNASEESENESVHDIPGRGFVSVTPLRENKKYTYDVAFYGSGDKRQTWTFNPEETGKFAGATYLGANDSVVLLEVLTKDRLLSKQTESTLIGLSVATGKKLFEMRTQDGRNQFFPLNVAMLPGSSEFIVAGLYYEGDERILRDKSEGLGIWRMSNSGKLTKSSYMSWERDFSKHMKVDQRGRIADLGYLYIHRIMQTEDGKIFAIGEGYKKVADGVGIAANILLGAGSTGNTKLRVTDMVMIELTSDFKLKNAKLYEKRDNNLNIGATGDFASPHTLAMVGKAWGAFDYSYTQMGKNNASFSSTYLDYEKSKGFKGLTYNAISYYDGKITTDKLPLQTEVRRKVFPAKPGFVVLMEYFKKDKRLEVRMEKLN